jgi:hypothetical protein
MKKVTFGIMLSFLFLGAILGCITEKNFSNNQYQTEIGTTIVDPTIADTSFIACNELEILPSFATPSIATK